LVKKYTNKSFILKIRCYFDQVILTRVNKKKVMLTSFFFYENLFISYGRLISMGHSLVLSNFYT